MTKFYSITDPIKYEGPESQECPGLSLVQSETEGAGQDHGGASALCGVLLAHAVLAGHSIPFGGETFNAPVASHGGSHGGGAR